MNIANAKEKRGRLFVIEGLDGSGKATQSKLLSERLSARGDDVRMLSFPCYDDDSSMLVRMYLSGEFGERPEDVNGYAAAVFYAADRFASYKKNWEKDYLAGAVFVADRYTTSNTVYQMSKLEPAEWNNYRAWLTDFEYQKLGIPKPDQVIYLDLPPDLSVQLMMTRYQGEKTRMDIHERDRAYQEKSRAAALYCAKIDNWHVVECNRKDRLRSVDEISDEIIERIKKAGY